MQVYVVLAGWRYEGYDADSVRVFSSLAEADAYGESLVAEDGDYDVFDVVSRKVQ
jgi:hypothetical protein